MNPSDTLSFSMSGEAVDLRLITRLLSEFADAHCWGPTLLMRVNLILEELVLNTRDHGVVPGRGIVVSVHSTPSELEIDFSDDGLAFDPLTDAPPPPLSGGLKDRQVGGLGIHLVTRLVDRIEYSRTADGYNRLSMAACRAPLRDMRAPAASL